MILVKLQWPKAPDWMSPRVENLGMPELVGGNRYGPWALCSAMAFVHVALVLVSVILSRCFNTQLTDLRIAW